MFTWETMPQGAVMITDTDTGQEVRLQPGDSLLDELEQAETGEQEQYILSQYFDIYQK